MAIASGKRPIRHRLLIVTNGDICLKEYRLHIGIKSSIKMIKARYYWLNMDKTINGILNIKHIPPQAKVYKHTKSLGPVSWGCKIH